MTEDEIVGCHHSLDGHEFDLTLGVGEGQGSMVCCNLWDYKELDMTERLMYTLCRLNFTILRNTVFSVVPHILYLFSCLSPLSFEKFEMYMFNLEFVFFLLKRLWFSCPLVFLLRHLLGQVKALPGGREYKLGGWGVSSGQVQAHFQARSMTKV